MASMNQVFLIGNLTDDPTIRERPDEPLRAHLPLCVNTFYRNKQGERVEQTCYVPVYVFGPLAETAQKYLAKGKPILIEGKLKKDTWIREDRQEHRLVVIGFRMQLLSKSEVQKREPPPPPEIPAEKASKNEDFLIVPHQKEPLTEPAGGEAVSEPQSGIEARKTAAQAAFEPKEHNRPKEEGTFLVDDEEDEDTEQKEPQIKDDELPF